MNHKDTKAQRLHEDSFVLLYVFVPACPAGRSSWFKFQTESLRKFLLTLFSFSTIAVLAAAQPYHKEVPGDPVKYMATEKTIFYKLGYQVLPIKVFQYGDQKNIVCINLHDNESTSVVAARSVLERKGGTLIKLENNKERVVQFKFRGHQYGFDPNGIFSRAGIEKTLKENGPSDPKAMEEVEKLAQRLLQIIPGKTSCIIALHNNTEEDYSVLSYLSGNERERDARAVYQSPLQDIDDIVFTTDSILYKKMADLGYNSIWQDNKNARRDGSLSVYCGEKKKRYINIETQHGKTEQYAEMLEKLLMILENGNKKDAETSDYSRPTLPHAKKPVDN